ncbi:MAG: transcription elongation factor GreA [Atopostipes suicloacalis]|nr:transcription elongation factor GreA [Atopostipes suicloacalis]MDN6731187.1 transcription elongation factor GreA [Atopostipes suicloacalis]
MNQTYPMTASGKRKLEEELLYLKEVKTKEIKDEIKKHHAFCDFSEDSSFDRMLDEEALLKKKINDLEEQIAFAEIIPKRNSEETAVRLGDWVEFKNLEEGTTGSYQIVGQHEANPLENKISYQSPIGQSFLGKEIGDSWTVQIPAGETTMKLLQIH